MSEMAGGIDAREFRNALGAFTTGVTIVTTRDRDGQDIGLTVNSFNSVSLDPPLVLWSLARSSGSLQAFLDADFFAVHILAADQEQQSNLFAKRGTDKFAGLLLTRGHGDIPLLDGCTARFECRSALRYAGGDHEIFVGEVITFENFDRPPLVFQGGKYALAMQKAARTEREAVPKLEADYITATQGALHVLLGMAYHQLSRNLAPELDRFGIQEHEYWLLNMVGAESGRSVRQLDELMSYTGKRVTPKLVQDLAARGFVRLAGQGDETHVSLVDLGRRVLIEGAAISKAVEQQAEGGFDYAETQMLKQLLQRVIRRSFSYTRKH